MPALHLSIAVAVHMSWTDHGHVFHKRGFVPCKRSGGKGRPIVVWPMMICSFQESIHATSYVLSFLFIYLLYVKFQHCCCFNVSVAASLTTWNHMFTSVADFRRHAQDCVRMTGSFTDVAGCQHCLGFGELSIVCQAVVDWVGQQNVTGKMFF